MKVKITKIKENIAYPGIIYAELREVGTNSLVISATLAYIFEVLKADETLECVNAAKNKHGNFSIII